MAGRFYNSNAYEFSSVVSVREYKQQILETIEGKDVERRRTGLDKAKVASEIEISEDTLAELEEVCSPSNLKCPAEAECENFPEDSFNISEVNLATVQALSQKDGPAVNPFQEKNYMEWTEKLVELAEEHRTKGLEAISGDEVVLSVALYHPATLKRAQEFLCLGRQKLTELRDKIYCPADYIVPGEHSEHPDFTTAITNAKDICPSGFMFIEGVFYNDTRDPLSRDYSKVIIDWVNKEERYKLARLGVFTRKKMEETKFEDLSIKLGYPYVYCHQGNCEHLLIFRDLRMLHVDDPQSETNYPFQIFRYRPKRQRCCICEIYTARWLTRNDPLMSHDPSLFCDKCFKSLHYRDDRKAYAFNVYQYSGEQYW